MMRTPESARRERERPRIRAIPLPLLVAVVGAAGFAATVVSSAALLSSPPSPGEQAGLFVLLATAILAESYPVPLLGVGAGGVSLAAVFIVAAGLLYGWAPAVLLGAATRLAVELRQRRPFAKAVYNGATYGLAAAGAGLASHVAPHTANVYWLILDALAGSTAFYLVNVVLIASVIASASNQRIGTVTAEAVRSTAAVFAIMFTVNLMLDALWQLSPVLSAALLGPLLAITLYQRAANRERAAIELALTDHLTGLGNHRAFQAQLERLLDAADATGSPVSLCVLDLDDFKEINDVHGHPAGDRALAAVGQYLRHDGEGFRLGGDEFALLLPGCEQEEAVEIASRVVRRIAADRPDAELATTVSAGVATYPSDGVERSHLARAADRALYAAKACGRNAVRCYQRDSIVSSERAIAAEGAIRARLDAASCLAQTIESRDAYTRNHCEAVAELAARLAVRIGLSGEEIELTRLAGRVHDVGKLAIAEEVLRKPGPLSWRERRTIETHTKVGYRMLSSLGIEPVATWVLHHHERWDGSGYPNGLRADEIPVGARILAVADAYEAMTTDRVYRESVSSDEALAEIQRCAHTQFDPVVVDALSQLLGAAPGRPLDFALAVA